jgi:Plasmid pRiA4b ORF-3-like protein
MSTSAPEQTQTVYQLKITLRGSSPLLWRRVLVSAETTIAQLHALVQTALGWEDLHLHRFRIQGRAYGGAPRRSALRRRSGAGPPRPLPTPGR